MKHVVSGYAGGSVNNPSYEQVGCWAVHAVALCMLCMLCTLCTLCMLYLPLHACKLPSGWLPMCRV